MTFPCSRLRQIYDNRADLTICRECRRERQRSLDPRLDHVTVCSDCVVSSPRRNGNGYPDGFEHRVVDGVQLVEPYWRNP